MAKGKPVIAVVAPSNNQKTVTVTRVAEPQVVDGRLEADIRDQNPGVQQ